MTVISNTFVVLQFVNFPCKLSRKVGRLSFLVFLSKVKAAPLRRLTAQCMPHLTWTVLYTPWGMLSKNLAWWQPDNSIHLIYPLDSADLPWQSITLTSRFPPGCGGRGRYTRGGTGVGRQSPTQLDRLFVWPGSMPATCPDISEHLLGGADISICPVERRERCVWHSSSAGMHVCVRHCQCAFSPLCVSTHVHCFVFHLGLVTWKISSKKGSETLRRTLRRKLMDLYQAVKIDNCHSSSGRPEVNPDQQGLTTHSSNRAYKSQHASVSFGCP